MKNILIFILTISSYNAFASCPEDDTRNAGGKPQSTNFQNGGKDSNMTRGVANCDPIKAVITYISVSSGGMGGIVGIGFALNAAPAGGSLGTIGNVNMSTISGCDGTSAPQRLADANQIYSQTRSRMQQLFGAYDENTPQYDMASRWLQQHTTNTLFKITYPDGTRGFFRIRDTGLVEESCG